MLRFGRVSGHREKTSMYYPSKTRKGISFWRFFSREFQENQEIFFRLTCLSKVYLRNRRQCVSGWNLLVGWSIGSTGGGAACLVAIFPTVSPRLASAGWVEYNRHRLNGRNMERYKTPGIPSSPRCEAGQVLDP